MIIPRVVMCENTQIGANHQRLNWYGRKGKYRKIKTITVYTYKCQDVNIWKQQRDHVQDRRNEH